MGAPQEEVASPGNESVQAGGVKAKGDIASG